MTKKNLPMNGILNSQVQADVIIKNPNVQSNLKKDTNKAAIEGSISLGSMPKYRQQGESLVVSKEH